MSVNGNKFYQWAKTFRRSDPRFRILEFFHNVERDGCKRMCSMDDNADLKNDINQGGQYQQQQQPKCVEGCFESYLDCSDRSTTTSGTNTSGSTSRPNYVDVPSSCFNRAGVFSVWRPCSYEAIQKMMTGQGVGKGLDIKGKSAKRGTLSGFVPFLQISESKHKRRIMTLSRDARMRIFYKTKQGRTNAVAILKALAEEMRLGYVAAKRIIDEEENSLRNALRASTLIGGIDFTRNSIRHGEMDREEALKKFMWDIANPSIDIIGDYESNGYWGMEVSQRVFWEGYVIRQSIERDSNSEYDTGRPSCPEFQDCNFKSLKEKKHIRNGNAIIPVVLQHKEDPADAMNVFNLLMAYENTEKERVMPVVSDFDCFLLGTRRVSFDRELPEEQKSILKWQLSKIRSILENPDRDETWTMQWLEMLKKEMSENGFQTPKPPHLGFGDPKSYLIMGHAVHRLEEDGCVRHGAECFNYTFPQDLDDKFFVISSREDKLTLELDREQLVQFLSRKADEGYVFPLNPKWILCDLGFKTIYDKLMANTKPAAKIAMKTWFPPETGVRELIAAIHHDHPDGFQSMSTKMYHMKHRRYSPLRKCIQAGYDIDGHTAMEMAMMELQHHCILQKCRVASHAIIASIRMYAKIQVYNSKGERLGCHNYENDDDDDDGSLIQYFNNNR